MPPPPKSRPLQKQFLELATQACEADDPELIARAISLASPDLDQYPRETMKRIVFRVFSYNAPKVLEYILSHGFEVNDIGVHDVSRAAYDRQEFPKVLVQILLDHGWNINCRDSNGPLLWHMISFEDAVIWCLEHGASVFPEGQIPWPDTNIDNTEEWTRFFRSITSDAKSDCLYHCPPILELAASQNTVAIFELLRSKGAPMGSRTLHKAVEKCATFPLLEDPVTNEYAQYCRNRMDKVRHLVDSVQLDVNARDMPPGFILGNFWGRPLHYVVRNNPNLSCREVTIFLLDRGAEPELLDVYGGGTPMIYGKKNFTDVVEEWRMAQACKSGKKNDEVDKPT